MAVFRQNPICPRCKKIIPGKYQNYSYLPQFLRPIGDSFLGWDWENHKCEEEKIQVVFAQRKTTARQQHASSLANVLYVPELKVAVGIESTGFNKPQVFINKSQYILDEGKILIRGIMPDILDVGFANIKIFEENADFIKKIVDNLILMEKIQIESSEFLQTLFKKIE